MLYTHEERAKKLADIKVNNIKQVQKIAPAVIEVLEKYTTTTLKIIKG